MPTCGCGNTLDATDLNFNIPGPGILIDGFFQNPGQTITAIGALAWNYDNDFTPTNFTLGANALQVCKYLINGKTVDIQYNFRFSANSTWAALPFGLPLPFISQTPQYSTSNIYNNHQMVGEWTALDSSANLYYEGMVYLAPQPTPSPFRLRYGDDLKKTNASVQQGTPFTFDAFDELSLHARIEII